VLLSFARKAAGALKHPAFPAPSVIEGGNSNNPDVLRRGNAEIRHCEPTGRANARPMTGAATQSSAGHEILERFFAWLTYASASRLSQATAGALLHPSPAESSAL
jgi:hypothetical protein